MSELFDTSAFSSKNDAARDFEIEDISSKKKVERSPYKSDSAWDDGSAFPSVSSKNFEIGDACGGKQRIAASGDDNQAQSAVFSQGETLKAMGSPQEEQLCKRSQSLGTVIDVNKKITITWENGLSAEYTPKQMQSYGYQKFLEEKGETECNSHNLTSAQELAQGFALEDSAQDSNLSESQKLMNTVTISSQNDSPMSATTVTCEVSQCEISENSGEKSTLLQLRRPASPSQSRVSDKEKMTPATVSPPSNEPLNQSDPNSSVLKMCQDSSPVAETPTVKHSIFSTSFVRLPSSATMRNGFVSAQDTLPAPTLENGYCWLESPGALSSTGKGRPPGQSRLEAQLRQHGLLAKGEVLRPDFLLNGYNLPPSYLDPLESRAATQLLGDSERQQEIFSILESQRSPLTESSTLINCPACQQKLLTLNDGCGTCGWIPENFLEETKPATTSTEKSKRRQRKGCLYRYIENKKLKDGTIASYPRVIGHRQPDNPTHWRWGFNWEEKIDGEWKGRSIGSVPMGAIALIQSMQNEGVSLEEIIGFIRRAKAKK